jgi:hypothetical protein
MTKRFLTALALLTAAATSGCSTFGFPYVEPRAGVKYGKVDVPPKDIERLCPHYQCERDNQGGVWASVPRNDSGRRTGGGTSVAKR